MIEFFTNNWEWISRLLLAMALGMAIGAERKLVHKEAGMKTHSLVAMGAAIFVIISEFMATRYMGLEGIDFNPAQMASNIIVGIGFLGAGSIMLKQNTIKGLTTASGLWVAAGIGVAAGFGLFSLAVVSTVLVLIVLVAMNFIEKPIIKISDTPGMKDFSNDSE